MPRAFPAVKSRTPARPNRLASGATALPPTIAADRLTATPGAPLRGRVRAPGDKSISHRALILGALAHGETVVTGLLEGEDVLATARAAAAFGAAVERVGDGAWRIVGKGGFAQPSGVIDCGNSGTGVRLLMGAAAAFPIRASFDGDASLRRRPMGRVAQPLSMMGARFAATGGERLPLTLHGGGLRGIAYTPPVASAQVKSAILLAGLGAKGETVVTEPAPTRDHTERMLRAFGADLTIEPAGSGLRVRVAGEARLQGRPVRVPGDPSSAAFPLVAGLITPGSVVTVEGVLLNPLRAGLYVTLREMGADLSEENAADASGEPIADLVARHGALRGVIVPAARAPSMIDEYPILAVAAAFAQGETVMLGVEELRHKESDRIALTAALLRACGVEVEEGPDRLVVHGRGAPPRGGGAVVTQGDHRIAMSGLVLGMAAQAPVQVDEASMIATSFPGFTALMHALGAQLA